MAKIDIEMWADIVIREWVQQMKALGIGHSDALLDSFQHFITRSAGGDVSRIMFAFNYYGKFVEMRVGRGFTFDFAKSPRNKRDIKPWYTRTFMRQVHRLTELLQEQYAEDAQRVISSAVKETSIKGGGLLKGMIETEL
jgi:hypothetical protein